MELSSKPDRLSDLKKKMTRWIENGAQVGWLVDPYEREVHVYTAGNDPATISGDIVEGTGPIAGFNLDLKEVWSRYEL